MTVIEKQKWWTSTTAQTLVVGALAFGAIKLYKKKTGSRQLEADPVKGKPSDYALPELPYAYSALEPIISDKTVLLQHQKHEASYIKGMNQGFNALNRVRTSKYKPNARVPMRQSIAKRNAYNISGAILSELFWGNLNGAGTNPSEDLKQQIIDDYGSVDMFMQEFFDIGKSIEGSGWVVLVYSPALKKTVILPIQNNQNNLIPNSHTLLAISVWEHAYYPDFENRKGDYLKKILNDINWDSVSERYSAGKKLKPSITLPRVSEE